MFWLTHESPEVSFPQIEIKPCVLQHGFTPLHLASQEGHTDMVSLLLEHKANVDAKSHVSTTHGDHWGNVGRRKHLSDVVHVCFVVITVINVSTELKMTSDARQNGGKAR